MMTVRCRTDNEGGIRIRQLDVSAPAGAGLRVGARDGAARAYTWLGRTRAHAAPARALRAHHRAVRVRARQPARQR